MHRLCLTRYLVEDQVPHEDLSDYVLYSASFPYSIHLHSAIHKSFRPHGYLYTASSTTIHQRPSYITHCHLQWTRLEPGTVRYGTSNFPPPKLSGVPN